MADNKKYQIIYADPPWSYYNDMSVDPDCTTVKGMRRPPYPVLSIKDICSFNVKDLNKIELFAREKHDSWDVFGNETESDIHL